MQNLVEYFSNFYTLCCSYREDLLFRILILFIKGICLLLIKVLLSFIFPAVIQHFPDYVFNQ